MDNVISNSISNIGLLLWSQYFIYDTKYIRLITSSINIGYKNNKHEESNLAYSII